MPLRMKKIPDVIWLQTGDEASGSDDPIPKEYDADAEITWCEDKINHGDTKYIRADLVNKKIQEAMDSMKALVEEARKLKDQTP